MSFLTKDLISNYQKTTKYLLKFGFFLPFFFAFIVYFIYGVLNGTYYGVLPGVSLVFLTGWIASPLPFLLFPSLNGLERHSRLSRKVVFYGTLFSVGANYFICSYVTYLVMSCAVLPGDRFCGANVLALVLAYPVHLIIYMITAFLYKLTRLPEAES